MNETLITSSALTQQAYKLIVVRSLHTSFTCAGCLNIRRLLKPVVQALFTFCAPTQQAQQDNIVTYLESPSRVLSSSEICGLNPSARPRAPCTLSASLLTTRLSSMASSLKHVTETLVAAGALGQRVCHVGTVFKAFGVIPYSLLRKP